MLFIIKEKKTKMVEPDPKMNFEFYKNSIFVIGNKCGLSFNLNIFKEYCSDRNLEISDIENISKISFDEKLFLKSCKSLKEFLKEVASGNRIEFANKFNLEFIDDIENEEINILVSVEYDDTVGFVSSIEDLMKYATNKKENNFLTKLEINMLEGLEIKSKDVEGSLNYIGISKKEHSGLNEEAYVFEEIDAFCKDISEVVVFTKEKATEKILEKIGEKNENK